jgi:hypothetical protein
VNVAAVEKPHDVEKPKDVDDWRAHIKWDTDASKATAAGAGAGTGAGAGDGEDEVGLYKLNPLGPMD